MVNMDDLVYKNSSALSSLNSDAIKNNLVPSIPVKCIHWFVRRADYEYEEPVVMDIRDPLFPNEYTNYYVKDNVNIIDSRFRFEKIKSAKIYLNSLELPNVSLADHNYFKYYIPLQTRLTSPEKNIYTYSFSINPINSESSGNLDFSQFNSDKTFLDVRMLSGNYSIDGYYKSNVARLEQSYTLYVYYVGLNMFTFEDGFMRKAT